MELIKDLGIKKRPNWKKGERFGLFSCPLCNGEVERILKDGLKQQRCSHKCYAAARERRGPYKSKIISKKYVYLYMPDHPHAIGTKKLYVAKHRLVMESFLGRYLEEDEVVHHKDENTMNNEIKNLQLMKASEHATYHKNKAKRDNNGKFTV